MTRSTLLQPMFISCPSKKEEISTYRSAVSEPDPGGPPIPAASSPDASVASADVVAAVEAVLLPLGLRGRQARGRQAQEENLCPRFGDGGGGAASDALGMIGIRPSNGKPTL